MTDWNQIVADYGRNVFRIAYRILGSVHDAEDVAQEAFCEAFQFQQGEDVKNWGGLLRRVATLRAIDCLRRKRPTIPLDGLLEASYGNPTQELEARELAERLRWAVGQLPDGQAAIFSLAYFDEQSHDQIAEALGISPAAVSTALYKARQRLKFLL
jgi:RNA polymerase sigma-70 factor (ECF subfamily)